MATYGPWEQGPDYTSERSTGMIPQAQDRTWHVRQGLLVNIDEVEPPDFNQALWDSVANDANTYGNWTTTNPSGPDPSAKTPILLEIRYGTSVKSGTISDFVGSYTGIGAGQLEIATSAYIQRRELPVPPDMPPDAIDYEYESDVAAVLSMVVPAPEMLHADVGPWATWVYSFKPGAGYLSVGQDAFGRPQVTDWNASQAFTAAITTIGPGGEETHDPAVATFVDEFTSLQTGIVPIGREIDLTPFILDAEGSVVLATRLKTQEVPSRPSDDDREVGAQLWNWWIRTTMRPPRHRWVYERVRQAPIVRVHPRDDGRGTASAARVWPPPKSRQGSGRRGPGSYE